MLQNSQGHDSSWKGTYLLSLCLPSETLAFSLRTRIFACSNGNSSSSMTRCTSRKTISLVDTIGSNSLLHVLVVCFDRHAAGLTILNRYLHIAHVHEKLLAINLSCKVPPTRCHHLRSHSRKSNPKYLTNSCTDWPIVAACCATISFF